jgi:hypothetical protein
MIIPYKELSADILTAVIEDFVSREGTDYGAVESSFATKVAQVKKQLERGEAAVTFDADTETCSIVSTR